MDFKELNEKLLPYLNEEINPEVQQYDCYIKKVENTQDEKYTKFVISLGKGGQEFEFMADENDLQDIRYQIEDLVDGEIEGEMDDQDNITSSEVVGLTYDVTKGEGKCEINYFFSMDEAVINEVKPRRAWNNRLDRINDLLSWMYDKDILTKAEKNKKDSLFHRYYRYYNDGDFPRGIKSVTPIQYRYGNPKTYRPMIELELEQMVEEFMKKLLTKYLPKINRKEFHKSQLAVAYNDVLRTLEHEDPHGLMYWMKKLPKETQAQIDIQELQDLYAQYNEVAATVPDGRYGDYGTKTYSYGKPEVIKAKPEVKELTDKIDAKLKELHRKVSDMKEAALKYFEA